MTGQDDIIIHVPDGHSLEGQALTMYPASGATTYTDGTVSFRSQRSDAMAEVRNEMAKLREQLTAMGRKP